MKKIVIGDEIICDDSIVLEYENMNSSFFNNENKEKNITLTISKSVSDYKFLNEIIKFLKNIKIIIYKKENIDIKKINQGIEIVDKTRQSDDTYRKLVYTLIYSKDIQEKIRILNNFNIHYTSKLLSMSYLDQMTEKIMNIEHFIYRVNNKSIIGLYSLLNYPQIDNLLNFPDKKEKVVENKEKKTIITKDQNINNNLILINKKQGQKTLW